MDFGSLRISEKLVDFDGDSFEKGDALLNSGSEKEDNTKDYTACSSEDCGYCGHCKY